MSSGTASTSLLFPTPCTCFIYTTTISLYPSWLLLKNNLGGL